MQLLDRDCDDGRRGRVEPFADNAISWPPLAPPKTAACREPVAVYRSKAAPRQAPKHLNPDHISLGDLGDRRIRLRRGARRNCSP